MRFPTEAGCWLEASAGTSHLGIDPKKSRPPSVAALFAQAFNGHDPSNMARKRGKRAYCDSF